MAEKLTRDTNHEGYRSIFNAALTGICANPHFFSSLFQQSPRAAVEFADEVVLAAIRSNGGRLALEKTSPEALKGE